VDRVHFVVRESVHELINVGMKEPQQCRPLELAQCFLRTVSGGTSRLFDSVHLREQVGEPPPGGEVVAIGGGVGVVGAQDPQLFGEQLFGGGGGGGAGGVAGLGVDLAAGQGWVWAGGVIVRGGHHEQGMRDYGQQGSAPPRGPAADLVLV
jgi:hypothetical protein